MPLDSVEGVVYTETIVHSPPERYTADAPYQIAIVDLDAGVTVRILGREENERARIGDRVVLVELRDGVSYYRKAEAGTSERMAEAPRPPV